MRKEFPRKILRQGLDRADGHCEGCEAVLKTGECEGDHILPVALGGDCSLSNLQILCKTCHKIKTVKDVKRIRKADRSRDKKSGAMKNKPWPKPPKQSKRQKPRIEKQELPRRSLYRSE
ncbi:MAG: HNH endonuclease [Ketobacter sp.]|nr:HNH endonuclease [Ketobacter sp.]